MTPQPDRWGKKKFKCSRSPLRRKDCKHRGRGEGGRSARSRGRSPGKRDIAANAEVDSPELGASAAAPQNERARGGSRSPLCRQRSAGNTPLRLAQTARLQRSEDAGPDRTIELSSPSRSPPRGNQQQNQVPLSASSAAALKQLHKQLQEKMVESKAAVARAETLVAEERAIAAQLHPLVEQAKVTLWRPPSRSRSRSRRCTAAPPMHLSRSRSRGHRQTEEPPVGEWKEHKAPSGRTYYCNIVTSCASWEKPGCHLKARLGLC